MKRLAFLLSVLSLLFFIGCKDDNADNPEFAPDEMARIFDRWPPFQAYSAGDTIRFTPTISPTEGATYRWTWTKDGVEEVISTDKNLFFIVPNVSGEATLKFETMRGGGKPNSREFSILMMGPFVPKYPTQNKHKLVGFLTKDGWIADVNWSAITHLVISSAEVRDGALYTGALDSMDIPTLVKYAHTYGVYVSLQVSGKIDYLNTANTYGTWELYTPAVNDPGGLAEKIDEAMKKYGVDGVDVFMDKNHDFAYYDDPAAVRTFYETLGNKIKSEPHEIDGNVYDYLLTMTVLSGWSKFSSLGYGNRGAQVYNLPQYDWLHLMAFLDEDLVNVPRSHAGVSYVLTQIREYTTELNCGPVDPSRLVVVVPSVGIRYFGIPKDYNWSNLFEYTEYIRYRDIFQRYPAHTGSIPMNNKIVTIDNGGDRNKEVDILNYSGLNEMRSYVEDAIVLYGCAGAGLWSLESDVKKDPSISLLVKLKEALDQFE